MTIRYHDPTGISEARSDDYALRLDLGDDTRVVGLLANGFPGSAPFLARVGDRIAALAPGTELRVYTKDDLGINASMVVPDQHLDKIAGECDGLVTAYGH